MFLRNAYKRSFVRRVTKKKAHRQTINEETKTITTLLYIKYISGVIKLLRPYRIEVSQTNANPMKYFTEDQRTDD